MPKSLEEALEFSEVEMESSLEISGKGEEKTSHHKTVSSHVSHTHSAHSLPLTSVGVSSKSDSPQGTLKPGKGTASTDGFAASRLLGMESKTYANLLFPELATFDNGDALLDSSDEDKDKERPLGESTVQKLIGDERHEEVEILVARGQKLTTLDTAKGACNWQAFKALSSLSLSHNMITDITPLLVLAPTLTDVNLSFNRITDLSPIFSCKALRRLWAAHNFVRCITGVRNCQRLEILSLFQNCLRGPFSSLANEISHLPCLLELDLDANPFISSAASADGEPTDGEGEPPGGTSCGPEKEDRRNHFAQEGARNGSRSSSAVSSSLQDSKDKLDLLLQCCPTLCRLDGVPVSRLKILTQEKSSDTKALACSSKRRREQEEASDHGYRYASSRSPRHGLSPGSPAKCPRLEAQTPEARESLATHVASRRARFASREAASPADSLRAEPGDESDTAEEFFGSGPDEHLAWEEVPQEAEQPSLASLKRTVKLLKQENQNMYGLMEENARLRMELRLGPTRFLKACARRNVQLFSQSLAGGDGAFAVPELRCFSARGVGSRDLPEKPASASNSTERPKPRPSTALPSLLPSAADSSNGQETGSPSPSRSARPPTPTPASTATALLPQDARPYHLPLETSNRTAEARSVSPSVAEGESRPPHLPRCRGREPYIRSRDGGEQETEKGDAEPSEYPVDEGESEQIVREREEDAQEQREAMEAETDMLRWENGVLRKRLERLVAYVELLRQDLDASRRTRPASYPEQNQDSSAFRGASNNARHASNASSLVGMSERGSSACASSPFSRPRVAPHLRGFEARSTEETTAAPLTEDDECPSPSTLFALLADPPATKAVALASKASLALARTAAEDASRESETQRDCGHSACLPQPTKVRHVPSEGKEREGKMTAFQRERSENANTELSLRARRGDAEDGDTEQGEGGRKECEKREDNESGAVGEKSADADLEALLKRNEENLKALRQDLRETEKILSRPASAASTGVPLRSRHRSSAPSSSAAVPGTPPRQPASASPSAPSLPRLPTSQGAKKSAKLDKAASLSSLSSFSSLPSHSSLSFAPLASPLSARPLQTESGEAARAGLSMRLSRRLCPPASGAEKESDRGEQKGEKKGEKKAVLPSRSSTVLSSAGSRLLKNVSGSFSDPPQSRPPSLPGVRKASPAPSVSTDRKSESPLKSLPRGEKERARISPGSTSLNSLSSKYEQPHASDQKRAAASVAAYDSRASHSSVSSLVSKRPSVSGNANCGVGRRLCSPSRAVERRAEEKREEKGKLCR
uniref:Internalin, putative n=1 Tax=Neospora caninum (strain Liverpool) TaxID=572307 RepID=A0A0F7URJ8_NEOCL|nr:TPA: internalin, putative [Neospora caninum Liverpool]